MVDTTRGNEPHNGLATLLMLAADGGASFIPLVIRWAGGDESPFLFNAGWRMGTALGCTLVLGTFFLGFIRGQWRGLWALRRRFLSWPVLGTALGTLDYALFALSIRFVDISISTILIETHPIMVVFLLAWTTRKGQRYLRNTGGLAFLLAACLTRFIFLIASQQGGFRAVLGGSSTLAAGLCAGCALALTGALVAALSAFTLRWYENLGREYSAKTQQAANPQRIALCCMAITVGAANLVSVPLNVSIGLVRGETMGPWPMISSIFIGGVLIQAIPSICWRAANLITDNLGVNALLYGAPILSLVWLWWFAQIGVARLDYLLIGASAIVGANVLFHIKAEIRLGPKSLIATHLPPAARKQRRAGLQSQEPFNAGAAGTGMDRTAECNNHRDAQPPSARMRRATSRSVFRQDCRRR